MMTVFERARAYVRKLPPSVSGSGGHAAAFEVACVLVKGFALPMAEAAQLMLEWNEGCQPPWSPRDVEHKLRQALSARRADGYLLRDEGGGTPRPQGGDWKAPAAAPKLVYDEAALRRLSKGVRVDVPWLANRSWADPALVGSEGFLKMLYRPGERVVVFSDDRSQGTVWPDAELPVAGPRGMWFLIQPVDGQERMNPRTGNVSRRSEESVTAWRYLLLESDEATPGLWIAAMVQVRLPIAAVYTSGGRSIHILWKIDAKSPAEWQELVDPLKAPLGLLGIDTKAMTRVRLSRLPGQPRAEKGGFQRLLYVNPFPLAEPIAELRERRDVARDWVEEAREAWKAMDVERMRRALGGLRFYGKSTPQMASAAEDLAKGLEALGATAEGPGV